MMDRFFEQLQYRTAEYQCCKCKHKWMEEPKAVTCPKCQHKLAKWLNYDDTFGKLSIEELVEQFETWED